MKISIWWACASIRLWPIVPIVGGPPIFANIPMQRSPTRSMHSGGLQRLSIITMAVSQAHGGTEILSLQAPFTQRGSASKDPIISPWITGSKWNKQDQISIDYQEKKWTGSSALSGVPSDASSMGWESRSFRAGSSELFDHLRQGTCRPLPERRISFHSGRSSSIQEKLWVTSSPKRPDSYPELPVQTNKIIEINLNT